MVARLIGEEKHYRGIYVVIDTAKWDLRDNCEADEIGTNTPGETTPILDVYFWAEGVRQELNASGSTSRPVDRFGGISRMTTWYMWSR